MQLAPATRVQALLANIPLFKELEADQLERIAEQTRAVRPERGAILFHRGDAPGGFHYVVYGQVKLGFVSPRGDEKVVEILGPGQSFGEAVMFMERPHVVTATAIADSMLLNIGKEAIFDQLARDPRFARRMIAGLASRLHHLVADVEAYSMHSGTQRVIGFLLSCHGGELPADPAAGLEITLPTTKGVIASRLNLTQEHFSRILHELSAQGLITVNARVIRVNRLDRLQSYAP